MPLATKNGSLIVKDGQLAENCGCCNSLCSPARDKATITISGLPSSCGVGALFDRMQSLLNRELSDDNCSYTLFRIRSYNNLCKYATAWHSDNNRWLNFGAGNAHSISLDLASDRLVLSASAAYVQFAPPAGKSFRDFPFDEVLTPSNVYQSNCPPGSFSNVRVVIDDSQAAYKPFSCPNIGSYETSSCIPNIDTIATYQNARVGNVETVSYAIPVYSCTPCDSNPYATQTTTTVYKVPCSPNETTSCIESVSKSSSWPELNLNVSFEGPDINGYSYAPLSGAYALKWTDNAYIGTAFYFGLLFPGWGLTDVGDDGTGAPAHPGQFGWTNDGQSPQQGLQAAEQGWRVDYRTQPASGLPMGMTLVVAPVKATTSIDRSTKSIVSTACGHGQIAYQVKLAVFDRTFRGTDSDYGYWNWSFSCYANVNCRSRVCRDVPTVSLNSTETVYVPTSGPWYETRGKLGQVKVSISS
jgi:hypothetical protein